MIERGIVVDDPNRLQAIGAIARRRGITTICDNTFASPVNQRPIDLGIDVVKTRLHRGRAAMRQKLDCYLNNHCLEDQPSPNPAPLTAAERHDLYETWKQRVGVTHPR